MSSEERVIPGAEALGVDQRIDHRRHQHGGGDPLGFDRAAEGLDVENRKNADEVGPHQGSGIRRPCSARAMGVEARQRMSCGPLPVGEKDCGHVEHASVRDHHALRATGGAAGIGERADRGWRRLCPSAARSRAVAISARRSLPPSIGPNDSRCLGSRRPDAGWRGRARRTSRLPRSAPEPRRRRR